MSEDKAIVTFTGGISPMGMNFGISNPLGNGFGNPFGGDPFMSLIQNQLQMDRIRQHMEFEKIRQKATINMYKSMYSGTLGESGPDELDKLRSKVNQIDDERRKEKLEAQHKKELEEVKRKAEERHRAEIASLTAFRRQQEDPRSSGIGTITTDPKDRIIAELERRLSAATTVDPRDRKIAELERRLAESRHHHREYDSFDNDDDEIFTPPPRFNFDRLRKNKVKHH